MREIFGRALASVIPLALCGIGSAMAADLPMKAAPVAVAAPVASWTGCYIDAGAGYGMYTQTQHTETFPGLAQTSVSDTLDGGKGWLGRFGAGCDYQFTGSLSRWVIGAFGDYDVMSLRGTDNFQNIGLGGVFGAPTWASEKESNAWSIGGRVGYLVTPALLTYVDVGYTQTHFDQQSFTFLNTGVTANALLPGATYHGWFAGGGTEYALDFASIRGLFWRNEYRYSSYSSKDLPTFGVGAAPGFAQRTMPYVQTVTSSLVWKFNWAQPVVAKY